MHINKIYFSDLTIEHRVKSKLRNSYISVDKNKNIVLKTPKVSQSFINDLLQKKERWIRKQLQSIQDNPPLILNLDDINSKSSKDFLKSRVEYYSKEMNLTYKELKYRKMSRRWGSCTSTKIITLNKKLAKTPLTCIDYVVVHELAHLVHMNHSKKFHQLVLRYYPSAEEAKAILSRIVFE